MAKQSIGLGTVANDGTGDDLRTAGDKINDNFDELYGDGHPGYVAGRWYLPYSTYGLGNGGTFSNGVMIFVPFIVPKAITVSDLGAKIATLSASGNFQLAIYASDPTTKQPTGNALGTTASISTGATGVVSAALAGGNITLAPGFYWMAVNKDANATSVVFQVAGASGQMVPSFLFGSASQSNISSGGGTGLIAFSRAQTYGTWPDMTGQSITDYTVSGGYCLLHLKAA